MDIPMIGYCALIVIGALLYVRFVLPDSPVIPVLPDIKEEKICASCGCVYELDQDQNDQGVCSQDCYDYMYQLYIGSDGEDFKTFMKNTNTEYKG